MLDTVKTTKSINKTINVYKNKIKNLKKYSISKEPGKPSVAAKAQKDSLKQDGNEKSLQLQAGLQHGQDNPMFCSVRSNQLGGGCRSKSKDMVYSNLKEKDEMRLSQCEVCSSC